jgi:hypothetical protein
MNVKRNIVRKWKPWWIHIIYDVRGQTTLNNGNIDCCLTPNEQFFMINLGENKWHFDDMTMMSVLY